MEILAITNVIELFLLIVVLVLFWPYLYRLTGMWEALLTHTGSVLDHARKVIATMDHPKKKARPIVRKRAMRAYPRRKIQPRRRDQ